MNAKIKRIELVNGCMLSFTLTLPADTCVEQFGLDQAIGNILNSSTDRRASTGLVNTFSTETTLKVGDEITVDGEVIEAVEASAEIENTSMPARQTPDYRDVFEAKRHN